ncbi:MAG: hypothetical protein ABH820_01965 [Patescibacteria group bacterium]|nr:hypothetical protein [Patescibacteria group bacterium]
MFILEFKNQMYYISFVCPRLPPVISTSAERSFVPVISIAVERSFVPVISTAVERSL